MRDIPDAEQIAAWSKSCEPCRCVVVGGGFIGLEMAEQLRRHGFGVTVVEALPQAMPARLVHEVQFRLPPHESIAPAPGAAR